MTTQRLATAGWRLARAIRGHGIRWTMSRALAMWRGKVAVHGRIGAVHRLLAAPPPMHWSPSLTDAQGVVPAVRVPNADDRAFEIPFAEPVAHRFDRVAVIAHIFYIEYADELLRYLGNLTVAADLFVSTDTAQKQADLERILAPFRAGTLEVRVTPNRGRDIGPKVVGFRDVYDRYEVFLHLHSKRSPHGGDALKPWRGYLLDHLLGSPAIVDSNLALLATDNVGLVFPQHMLAVRGVLNWGYDFPFARDLLARAGVALTKEHLLEFPSGSMFWARTDALRKLLALDLTFDDFEEEAGKVDGTLAHAIERSYLFFCEAAGYRWAKVSRRDSYPLPSTLEPVADADDIRIGLRRVFRTVLCPPLTTYTPLERTLATVRRLLVTPSPVDRARINLLIPTINPHQTFGGVATAIRIFDALRRQLGARFDARIVVTDAPLEPAALEAYADWAIQTDGNGFDHETLIVDDISGRKGSLPLRRGDVFIASAWWNAQHALDCGRMQRTYFDHRMPFVYLIQDFEPNFSAWSSQWAAAESTYFDTDNTIAIINSNELFTFMTSRYRLPAAFVLPYEPNATIRAAIRAVPREKLILIYGRPSVLRNCFEVIVNGLVRWQTTYPSEAAQWQIVSLGETYPEPFAYPVQNFRVLGKVGLEEYGALLSRASIGISLMLSPHPSYPPLEMAMAGMLTITNRFDGKNLAVYSDQVMNVETISADGVAASLAAAVVRSDALPAGPSALNVPAPVGPCVDYEALARTIVDSYYGGERAAVDRDDAVVEAEEGTSPQARARTVAG
jgi:hypothetical protein